MLGRSNLHVKHKEIDMVPPVEAQIPKAPSEQGIFGETKWCSFRHGILGIAVISKGFQRDATAMSRDVPLKSKGGIVSAGRKPGWAIGYGPAPMRRGSANNGNALTARDNPSWERRR